MNGIDILVIAVLLISGVFAYMRGFVHETLSIAGWVGASFVTLYATPLLKPFARRFIDTPFWADLLSGALIFIVTLAVLFVVTRLISRGVKESALGALDRALGFLFGLLRGAVIVSLIWIGYAWTTPLKKQPAWIHEARTLPLVIRGAEILNTLVPPNFFDAEKKNLKTLNLSSQSSRALLNKAINAIPKSLDKKNIGGYSQKERNEMNRIFETNK